MLRRQRHKALWGSPRRSHLTEWESPRFSKKQPQHGGDWGRQFMLTSVLHEHTCTPKVYSLFGYVPFVHHPFVCWCICCLYLLDGMKIGLWMFLFKCLLWHLFRTSFITYLFLELLSTQQSHFISCKIPHLPTDESLFYKVGLLRPLLSDFECILESAPWSFTNTSAWSHP